ncbi:isoflavone reductase family protein [Dothidotthia symphoricarpi CBS 119687]|uniref:Isoflavone reductase family protein n=1 Tax=Dothidotthia symphoricarpi CBS 119687 TaxID=1392245 RepID=A0A6A6A1C6_9PLEO|nr:isoflavone reductase family protein [Dothidotthia symphoricarpi CBS 119687]KAF2125649.1 isoflavone reductase family protein [Dothidotthia symphoricarpi CBS 119687]
MAIENITIIGNSSLTHPIITALLSTPSPTPYKISILTHPSHPLSLPPHIPPNTITHKTSDFTPSSLHAAFLAQDLLISITSGTDTALQTRIITAALAAGVPRFIPHEFTHDTQNPRIQSRLPASAARAKVLAHLAAQDGQIEYVGVATGYALDAALASGEMGFDLAWHSATMHGAGTEVFPASSLAYVGRVVAAVVRRWDVVRNSYIYAAGVLTCAEEVLGAVERVTGREWTVGRYGVEECVREGGERIKRGFLDSGVELLERSLLYDGGVGGVEPFRTRGAREILGLEGETVQGVVEAAYHAFKHRAEGCGC